MNVYVPSALTTIVPTPVMVAISPATYFVPSTVKSCTQTGPSTLVVPISTLPLVDVSSGVVTVSGESTKSLAVAVLPAGSVTVTVAV